MVSAAHSRLARIRSLMEQTGVELMIAYSNGKHSFLDMDPVWFAADYKSLERAALFVPATAEPLLLVSPADEEMRARMRSWVGEVIGSDDFLSSFASLVAARGWTKSRAAVAGLRREGRAAATFLRSCFARPVEELDEAIEDLAAAKDEYELGLLRAAASIAEQGFRRLLEVARPGVPEYEVAAEVEYCMRCLGADDNFQLLSASQHNRAVHPPTDRRLEVGDILLAEISPSYGGAFVQICRTAVVGRPSRLVEEKYALLSQALEAGLQACRPGATAAEVAAAVDEPVVQAGYGRYCRPPYLRVRGHGFGLGSTRPGDLASQNPTVLKEGMVFIIHPNQYLPETGYLLCGDPVVITREGAVLLTTRSARLDYIE